MIDKSILSELKRNLRERGVNPDLLPGYKDRYTPEQLEARLETYREDLEVIRYFVDKFLSSVSGSPILIGVSDNEGYLLAFQGDAAIMDIVRQLGFEEGVRFDDELDLNAVTLCLRFGEPVQLTGEDHYHTVLHRLACCTVPWREANGSIAGTLSFMTGIEVAHPHMLAILSTVADSVERELKLRDQNDRLLLANQLAVGIAHEIRNPLTTVKGMLQMSSADSKPLHFGLILSELERMNLIVGELLLMGKPQAAVLRDESCQTILEEVLSVFEFQAAAANVEIRREFVRNLAIRCDRNQIKQVFLNLLRNALEALPDGGVIEVKLDAAGPFQQIRFKDDGEGMTEAVLGRIGEPYHTTRPNGHGLGMMIVSKLVSSHRGRMAISSKPGQGTCVDLYLPASTGGR